MYFYWYYRCCTWWLLFISSINSLYQVCTTESH